MEHSEFLCEESTLEMLEKVFTDAPPEHYLVGFFQEQVKTIIKPRFPRFKCNKETYQTKKTYSITVRGQGGNLIKAFSIDPEKQRGISQRYAPGKNPLDLNTVMHGVSIINTDGEITGHNVISYKQKLDRLFQEKQPTDNHLVFRCPSGEITIVQDENTYKMFFRFPETSQLIEIATISPNGIPEIPTPNTEKPPVF